MTADNVCRQTTFAGRQEHIKTIAYKNNHNSDIIAVVIDFISEELGIRNLPQNSSRN